MFKKTKVCTGVLLAIGAVAVATPAVAQEAQRIEVTGSRILSLGAQSPSPLQVFSAEDIARSGVTNIQELILKNPTLGTPGLSRTNSNFSTASAGVATVDLRNLGSDRTLVLVNGRRFVAGIPGTATVDLNTIPTDFIERVEILTGGSSATYGSDAVAGVVNIILKRSFEGLIFDASVGRSEFGDDKKRRASVTFGVNSANGKGNAMAHFAYSTQGVVFGKSRPGGEIDSISTGAAITGNPDQFFDTTTPFLSSFAPQGRFLVGTGTAGSQTFNRSGTQIPYTAASGFNRQEFRTLAIPTERLLFAGKGDYNFAPDHTVFIEGTYAQTKTTTRLEPFPLDSNNIYPVVGAGRGRAPAEALVNGVVVRNPLVPDGIYSLLADRDGDGLRDYGFTRRLSEVGNRGNNADRGTFRVVSGVRGTFFGSWDYEAYASYGSTTESQVSSGQVNVLNFRNALDAIPDANDINGNGNRTEAICRDAVARAQGCVPLNLFGFNSASQAAINYVTAPGLLATFTSQKSLVASVSSAEVFKLPAGGLAIAAGVEYREEFSRSEFDPLQQAGLNAGNAIPRTEGEFDVSELFFEARIPILKDVPAAKMLSATIAARSGDYSTVGKVNSYNGGFEWAPVSSVKIRATQAVSTRAPNVGELYSPASQTFPTGLTDPCLNVTAVSSTAASVRCRADAGVAANIVTNTRFTLTQADTQGISGFNIGNPSLKQEKGTSTTFGIVVTPEWAPLKNTSFTLDYFKIKVQDTIGAPGRQFILDQCYTGDASFCQFVERRGQAAGVNNAGSIRFINAVQRNNFETAAEGIDFTAAFSDKVGPGRLGVRLAWTHLLKDKSYNQTLAVSDKDVSDGEIGEARDKASLNLSYNVGPFGISALTTYIGKSYLDDSFLSGYDAAPRSYGVAAKVYTDLQFSYTWRKARFYVGIDNAFDTKAPSIPSGLPDNVTGSTTASDVYDAIGRRYYVGVRLEM
jgi:iron complex outermembrane receptor protein